MKFVENSPAMLLDKYLVVSDLHLGYEEEYRSKGYTIPDQTETIIKRLELLSKLADKLIILGDLKHKILRKESMLDFFFTKVCRIFSEVLIIKGNHDGRIEDYASRFNNIKVFNELLLRDVLLIHGHRTPSISNLEKAKIILLGHFHSSIRVLTHLGTYEKKKVWTVYDFRNKKYYIEKKVKTVVKKVVSFPCFNELFEGRGERLGPLTDYLVEKEVLMLDLTKLV